MQMVGVVMEMLVDWDCDEVRTREWEGRVAALEARVNEP